MGSVGGVPGRPQGMSSPPETERPYYIQWGLERLICDIYIGIIHVILDIGNIYSEEEPGMIARLLFLCGAGK
jgi:hypothetical protein